MADVPVAIIGGGLAGLTASLALSDIGLPVTTFEAATIWGGKSGASEVEGVPEDHGYHVLPPWYANAWAVIDRLDVKENFFREDVFHQLRRGAFPRFDAITAPSASWSFIRSLVRTPIGLSSYVLMLFALLEALGDAESDEASADSQTIEDFLLSRSYATERMVHEFNHLFVTANTVSISETSRLVLQRLSGAILRNPRPLAYTPRFDLGRSLIDPFVAALRSNGVRLLPGCPVRSVEPDGDQFRVHFAEGTLQKHLLAERVIMATPVPPTVDILSPMFPAYPSLRNMATIRHRPLGALHVYTSQRISGLPKEHVRLFDSKLAIALVDVSYTFGQGGGSVLNLDVGRCEELFGLPEEQAIDRILTEVEEYLPTFHRHDVQRVVFQPHWDEAMPLPTSGSWTNRPKGRSEAPNLYLAGDYCQSWIVLPTMEAAISSGLAAAQAVIEDLGGAAEIGSPSYLPPRFPPALSPGLARALRIILRPFVAVASATSRAGARP